MTEKNPALRREIKLARRALVPDNYIKRVIQFAKQGYKDIDFPVYDTDWDSEAYLTVSGQNSNNSVSLKDDFLRAVETDGDWNLIGRTTGKVTKTLKARELWEKIGHAAWASADPGLHFNTTMNDWHTCKASGDIRASNPCSEYMFLDDTACNLASANLLTFYDTAARRFDVEAYEHLCRLWTVVLEISVMMAQFPSKQIADLSYEFRTLGLGFANIGGLLMTMGLPYDSKEGRALCGALTAIMTGVAYATSAEMAGELGPFAGYKRNADNNLIVAASSATATRLAQGAYPGNTMDQVRWLASVGADYGVIAVAKDSPINTLPELMDKIKADPGSVAIAGGSAVGGWDHLKVLIAARKAGIEDVRKIKYVAFDGGGEAVTQLLAGSVQAFTGDASEAKGFVQSGDIKVLAVLAPERMEGDFASFPTAKEQGIDAVGANWRGFYAPGGMSDDAYAYWVDAIGKVYDSPEWKKVMAENGLAPLNLRGDDFQAFVKGSVDEITALSKEIGILK